MITTDWRVIDVVKKYPRTYDIFKKYHITVGCWGGDGRKTLEQAALVHRIDVNKLMEELQALEPKKPWFLKIFSFIGLYENILI